MASKQTEFTESLPELLQALCDPVTPYTCTELRCRIEAFGWQECLPMLRSELHSGSNEVRRLILAVVSEEADQTGRECVQTLLPSTLHCLTSQDRLLRQAAVLTLGSLGVMTQEVGDALRAIIVEDELAIAREALTVLAQLNDSLVSEIAGVFGRQ